MRKPVTNVNELIGEQISAVAFVQDYVEFHFDEPIVRSLSNSSIISQGKEYRFPDAGSRDALCSVIGAEVLAVKLEDDRALEMRTSNNCTIQIPLDDINRLGPEAMHFVPELNKPMQVW